MIKKIASLGIGSLLLVTPLVTSADTMSELQARIQGLLGQVQSLQVLVNQTPTTVQQSTFVDDEGTATANTGIYCPRLSTTVQRGNSDSTTGGQVSELQSFLTDYYDLNESVIMGGFYGQLTQNYVARFQQEHNLPPLGLVGARTRAVIASVCGGASAPTPMSVTPPPLSTVTRSATVDAHETFHSSTFTLAGSAQNTETVVVALVPYPSYQGSMSYEAISSGSGIASGIFIGPAIVTNGRWSESFFGIPNGAYTLVVYDITTHFILISSGTVVVDTAATPPVTPPPPPTTILMPMCPVFQLPLCTNGTIVSQGLDVNGCPFPSKCVANVADPAASPGAGSILYPDYLGTKAGYPIVVPTCTLGARTTTISDVSTCVSWCRDVRLAGGLVGDLGTKAGVISGSCVFKSSTGVSTVVAEAATTNANLANALSAMEAVLLQMLATIRQ